MKNLVQLAREFNSYSRKDFADKANIGIDRVSIYEGTTSHVKSIPKDDRMKLLSETLNIDEDLLFFSYGVLPPHLRDLFKTYPFYYLEKIREICENGPKIGEKTEKEIEYTNKIEISKYIKPPTA